MLEVIFCPSIPNPRGIVEKKAAFSNMRVSSERGWSEKIDKNNVWVMNYYLFSAIFRINLVILAKS